MEKFNSKKFSRIIEKLIEFRAGTTRLPIKDVGWEELIWAALVFMYGGKNVEWDSQSHTKSVDLKVEIDGKLLQISAKGGIIKNGALSVSSYRLTTFNNLSEKLKFIGNQHAHFDFYLICAREEESATTIRYSVIKVPASKFAPLWMLQMRNWKKTNGGYELKEGLGFAAKIVSKMSNQLWYSIPLEYFAHSEILATISLPKESLGVGLLEFLRKTSAL